MIEKFVTAYQEGAITGHHLVVAALENLDPGTADAALALLPADVLPELVRFVAAYRPGRMVSNYGNDRVASPDQVEAARRWIESRHRDQKPGKAVPA